MDKPINSFEVKPIEVPSEEKQLVFDNFKSGVEVVYRLYGGGYVRFNGEELQSIQRSEENTLVILKNGVSYLLEGTGFGV